MDNKQPNTDNKQPIIDVFDNQQPVAETKESPRSKRIGIFDSLIIGPPNGDLCIKINREGFWAGSKTSTGAPIYIHMDGTNNIVASGTFTDLTDTFSAYTVNNALISVNATHTGIIETGVTVTEASNTFTITKGSAIVTALAGTNTFASLSAGGLVVDSSGYLKPITSDDASAPNNSIYYSSDLAALAYRDGSGVSHTLY